jgi:hypothetical protein
MENLTYKRDTDTFTFFLTPAQQIKENRKFFMKFDLLERNFVLEHPQLLNGKRIKASNCVLK